MHSTLQLRESFESFLENFPFKGEPSKLYDPVDYIMKIGGKRIRPLLVLHASELFGGNIHDALFAALSLEVFHNFTLVHDDIMDDAMSRRGRETVHVKYDTNTAILSGDVMLIMAYELIGKYEKPEIQVQLLSIFNKLSRELCEGQQLDMDFENRNNVTVDEYIKMITLKTGVLIAGALEMGAVIAGASKSEQQYIYNFGKNIGIAFQIQDDLLDTFGEFEKVGKKIGGDIVQNKKTYLYLKALELADDQQKKELVNIYNNKLVLAEEDKILKVKNLFHKLVIPEYARQLRDAYLDLAYAHLAAISVNDGNKKPLIELAQKLVNRES